VPLGALSLAFVLPGPARSAPGATQASGTAATGTTTTPAQAPPVSVFPVPGSQVVPPGAQIAFRGISPYSLGSVSVSGSVTGSHPGTIAGDSDGNGGSFIPAKPFKAGETVTVTTSLNLIGAPSGSYQFRVATSPGPVPFGPPKRVSRAPGDVQIFRTRPDLRPPAINFIKGPSPRLADYVFLAPQFGPLQEGPMLLDPQGRLLFFKPMHNGSVAADFRIQQYQGNPVLTWWQGYSAAGVGVGQDEIYNSSYQEMAQVHAADGLSADLHEFLITPRDTALITVYYPVIWDTRAVGGSSHRIVLDSVVQEIDIPTGLKLFEWDSLDHVPLRDSYLGPSKGSLYDPFHVNSIQPTRDGNLIISGRNTWSALKVSRSSAATMWTLGGKHSSFRMGPGAAFAYQHDVRVHGSGDRQVSLFDDADGPPPVHQQSRGLVLDLDYKRMTATVAAQRDHTPLLLTRFQGNLQMLPGGGSLIGWGQQPYFTEFGRAGQTLLDARFVSGTSSYRAYAFPSWSGTPAIPPAVAAANSRRTTTVYASWNGSTETAFWLVLGGRQRGGLSVRRLARRTGFETTVRIAQVPLIRVEALDARGHVLGTSRVIKTR
jgi:hypothetical protein